MSKEKNNFEESIQKLQEIINQFQKGNLFLDDSIKLYEEGMQLIQYCEQKLSVAENKAYILKNQFLKNEKIIDDKVNDKDDDKVISTKESKLNTTTDTTIKEKRKIKKDTLEKKVIEEEKEEIHDNFDLFNIIE